MEIVGSRTRDDIHETRGGAAVLRTIRGYGDLELLDRIFAEDIRDALTAARCPEIVAASAGPVDRERVRAVGVSIAGILSALFTCKADQTLFAVGRGVGNEQRKVKKAASAQRQSVEQVAVDDGTQIGIVGLQQRRFARHG